MAMSEVDFLNLGKGNTTPSFIVQSEGAAISSAVASSTSSDSRFTIDKSYDGSDATAWIPANIGSGVPYNAVYDLGSEQSIFLISLLWGCSDGGTYVTKVSIDGSNDGNNYTPIVPETTLTVTNSPWNAQTKRDLALINKKYRYFKIKFERVSGTSAYCMGIGEIVFVKD